jgi:hypothetical protein
VGVDVPQRNRRPRRPTAGASLEVIRHHADRHIAKCGCEETDVLLCPCGTTMTFRCERGLIVLWGVRPHTWCEHAVRISEAVA